MHVAAAARNAQGITHQCRDAVHHTIYNSLSVRQMCCSSQDYSLTVWTQSRRNANTFQTASLSSTTCVPNSNGHSLRHSRPRSPQPLALTARTSKGWSSFSHRATLVRSLFKVLWASCPLAAPLPGGNVHPVAWGTRVDVRAMCRPSQPHSGVERQHVHL
jgi:hypothetical protein